MGKAVPETIKLIKKAYEDKRFGESMIFRWHGDFKKERLSTKLALKAERPEIAVNDQNVSTCGQSCKKIVEWHERK